MKAWLHHRRRTYVNSEIPMWHKWYSWMESSRWNDIEFTRSTNVDTTSKWSWNWRYTIGQRRWKVASNDTNMCRRDATAHEYDEDGVKDEEGWSDHSSSWERSHLNVKDEDDEGGKVPTYTTSCNVSAVDGYDNLDVWNVREDTTECDNHSCKCHDTVPTTWQPKRHHCNGKMHDAMKAWSRRWQKA
jgi:hypothetical protein